MPNETNNSILLRAAGIPADSTVALVLVVICASTTVALALSNIPTVMRIIKNKSVGTLPAMPFLSICVTNLSYGLYGIVSGDITCMLTLISAALALIYSIIYGVYVPRKDRLGFFSQALCAVLVAALQVYLMIIDNQKWLSINIQVIGVALYFSPLASAAEVCRSKNTESMPLPLSLMAFLNASSWAFYGYFVLDDATLWTVCSMGTILTTGQLLLIFIYWSPRESEEEALAKKENVMIQLV